MLTRERMRDAIAAILGEDPAAIGDEENLIDLGLDSIRAMVLVQEWNAAGAHLDLASLAERPTLGAWWALVRAG